MKPGNIVLTTDWTAMLCDFGISKIIGATTSANMNAPTVQYALPESFDDGPVTAKLEVWCLIKSERKETTTEFRSPWGERLLVHLHGM